jgi:hypothetical protein
MQRILKYELDVVESQVIDIQSDKILSIIEQNGNIVVYAVVDDTLPMIGYRFFIIGTGSKREHLERYFFLGTVKLAQGQLVFHVYYKRENSRSVGV